MRLDSARLRGGVVVMDGTFTGMIKEPSEAAKANLQNAFKQERCSETFQFFNRCHFAIEVIYH